MDGLAGVLNGTINNVQVDGLIQITKNNNNFSFNYIAGIVGYMQNGIISNSTNNIDISSNSSNVAGIVGTLENGKLINNVNNGNIDGNNCTASGIVSNSHKGEITRCENYGTISSHSAAGIIGSAAGVDIIECSNYGEIIVKNINSNQNSYQGNSGGIAGFLYSSTFIDEEGNTTEYHSKIEKCFNVGNINVQINISGSNGVDVGGLVGSTLQNNDIHNSYNAGRITVQNSYNILVGGLIGRHQSDIINCYNVGILSTTGDYSDYRVCELIGAIVRMDTDDTAGKVHNCYCSDRGLNALSNDGGSKELEYYVLNFEELKVESSYNNFNFENIWTFDLKGAYSYPQLKNNYIKETFKFRFKLNGTIKTYGTDETEKAIISISNRENLDIKFEKEVAGTETQAYDFELESGKYLITVAKNHHITREYEIEIRDKDVEYELEIFLIGDMSGDGKVNIKDWNRLYNHINETNILTDYELLCADVNKDGKVNIKDWNRLYNHINEINPLW